MVTTSYQNGVEMTYTSVAKIANIRCKLHKVLPAVYDESLSYLEQLAKLTFKVNETIEATNALNDNVTSLNDDVFNLNKRVEAVEGEIDGFEAEINQRVNELEVELRGEINTAISDMQNQVDNKMAEVDGKINELDTRVTEIEIYVQTTVDNLIHQFHEMIQYEIERLNELYHSFEDEMRQYVEDTVNELIANIPDLTNIYVIDPTTGKLLKVQDAINNIFYFNLSNAFTCDEYNKLGLTCDQINTIMYNGVPIGLTVYGWLHDAKKVIENQVSASVAKNFVNKNIVAKNYLTGEDCWVKDNVDLNMSQLAWSGCFTSDEINTNGFSCDEIIAFNIDCENYVQRANEIMISA